MIIKAERKDLPEAAGLAVLLWESHSVSELETLFENLLANGKTAFFLKFLNDVPVGFAQCQLRYDYVEGTSSAPVGYLEGLFVKEEYRKQGIGKELLDACEKWAKEKGCREFASDCELENTGSFAFHLNVGFKEANKIICFVKKI